METLLQIFQPLNIVLAQAGDYASRRPSTADTTAFGTFALLPIVIFLFWGIIMLICAGGFVIWLLMLIDCAKRDFCPNKENDKLIWILVIVLVGWIGAIIYYFVVKRPAKAITKTQQKPTNEIVSQSIVDPPANETKQPTK